MEEQDILETMGLINEALDQAQQYGLTTEVVYSALTYLKQHPTMSVEDAILFGLEDWVK